MPDAYHDEPQELIARRMAEGVVDVLEVIEIEKQHGDEAGVALRRQAMVFQPVLSAQARQSALEAVGEEGPVR